jgi:predicted secreted protein
MTGVTGKLMTLTIEGDALANTRNFTLTGNQDTIDTSNRDGDSWREFIIGLKEWSIDFDGLYIYSDVAYAILMEHYSTGTPASLTCIITMPDSDTFSGECTLETFSLTGPFDEVLTLSGTLKGTGALADTVS